MTTPADPTNSTNPTDPTSPSVRALRAMAFGALALLVLCALLTAAAVLQDAIGGDGVNGGFAAAGGWSLAASGFCALLAAAAPRDAMAYRARAITVTAAYALAILGPVLAALD
ncbi:hypothetical protein [Streptomyces roseicoloratus]|uniref:Integral membrane protein n=1 Tax=Streptomyces roseicoloratus TaxID=2508722 RepID=A0ABY9RX14_9ACTN|nr:hypothetical protein [Streptomyces roseicoloratus]WMX45749.1 hypothetical protein RGF97_14015 [Streptomyces roseicoloratus]